MNARSSRPSRRAMLVLGGGTALAAAAWQLRPRRHGARRDANRRAPAYVDHDGWLVSPAEKAALVEARSAVGPETGGE